MAKTELSSQKPDSGITLLEVLLAMVVFAMIGVSLSSMFATGGRIWSRVDRSQNTSIEATARFQLRDMLNKIPATSHELELSAIFEESQDGFRFRQGGPEHNTNRWISITYSEDEAHLTMTVLFEDEAPPTRLNLYSNLQSTAFSYFGSLSVRGDRQWRTGWQGATVLPRLIKIETVNLDETPNPPLIIEPAKFIRQSVISASSLVPPG